MRYDDTVILWRESEGEKELLGDAIVKEPSCPVPCFRNGMTLPEQMAIFGKYRLDSFKLYLKGKHDGFSEVEYQEKRYKIAGRIHHRGYTVVYI